MRHGGMVAAQVTGHGRAHGPRPEVRLASYDLLVYVVENLTSIGGGLDVRGDLSRRRLLGAGVSAAGLLAAGACGTPAAPPAGGPRRSVTHALGVTDVPVTPQRVVSLDSNAALQVSLELAAPLIASETLGGDVPVPGYLPAPPAGFERLGFNELNLEKLAALRPDLIIGNTARLTEKYASLSAIAPTVAYRNAGTGVDWRDSVRLVGDVLGAAPEIDKRLTTYAERVRDISTRHATALQGRTFTLLRFNTSELRIVRAGIFGSSVLTHVGARRAPSTDLPGENATYLSLSEETVSTVADADVILYFVGGGDSSTTARDTFDRYTGGGLWGRLPAVAGGRAIEIDPIAWWDGYSVSAGLACLDQLDAALTRLS